VGKFPDGGWRLNEADIFDALGLTESKSSSDDG